MTQGLRFYQHKQLKTDVENAQCRTLFSSGHQALAEWRNASAKAHSLLAIDASHSVLYARTQSALVSRAYSPYGHCAFDETSRQGFNGERYETLIKAYALGQGYRLYSPDLMRFLAPDSVSPFGQGGLNSYVYCCADPVNRRDPSGHIPMKRSSSWTDFTNKSARKRQRALSRDQASNERGAITPTSPPAQPQYRDLPAPLSTHASLVQAGVSSHISPAGAAQQHAAMSPLSAAEKANLQEELQQIQVHKRHFEAARPVLEKSPQVAKEYEAYMKPILERENKIIQDLIRHQHS